MCGMVMSELNMPAVPVFSDDQFFGVVSLVVPVTRGVQRALTGCCRVSISTFGRQSAAAKTLS